jgi:hypothetical protein
MSLADLQRQMRDAVVTGSSGPLASLLVGGRDAAKRLGIHHRHYTVSLATAIVGRFPATGWLVGPGRLEDAARDFVRKHPPTALCIAEYGAAFPAFLSEWPATADLTYVPAFADLDWQLGRLAVAVDMAAVGREQLATHNSTDLADLVVTLQPGTHYVEASWAIDALMKTYLADTSSESWTLTQHHLYLEVRGARGSFRFSRLRVGDYMFRRSVASGVSLGDAARGALELDSAFDPGAGLLSLLDERLITSIGRPGDHR